VNDVQSCACFQLLAGGTPAIPDKRLLASPTLCYSRIENPLNSDFEFGI
jgi:hypothetical protein